MPTKCWCGDTELLDYSTDYRICASCHTLVNIKEFSPDIYSVTDEQNDLYGINYWEEGFLELAGVSSLPELHNLYMSKRCSYWLQTLLSYVLPPASVAEIGCGLGQMPYMVKTAGFTQVGVELSPKVCEYARQTFDVEMVCGTVDDLSGKYDAILLLDLIEHLLDPIAFMESITKISKPETVLLIQTPCYNPDWNYDQMLANSKFSDLLDSNQHIYLFSRLSMEKLLKQFGFCHISFERAYFGNNYDMFLVASQKPLRYYEYEEAMDAVTSQPKGWLLRTMFNAQLESKQQKNGYEELMKRKDKEVATFRSRAEEAREQRMEAMNLLAEIQQEGVTTLKPKAKKKNLLYVGYTEHLKTQSTRFLLDILKTEYNVYEYAFSLIDPHVNNGFVGTMPPVGAEYDVMVVFQIAVSNHVLENFGQVGKVSYFPMFDAVYALGKEFWDLYKGINIVNFSRTLHEVLLSYGHSSHYIQYFPKPFENINWGSADSAFFWERSPKSININTCAELLKHMGIKNIHLHAAPDLQNWHIPPTPEVTSQYNITKSEWFETKSDMLKHVEKSAYYVAPRALEGIGMSFLEAMAMGRCVIAVGYPTMNEYIINGENGILYDYENQKITAPSDVLRLQKNAHETIATGYAKWEKEKYNILELIKM